MVDEMTILLNNFIRNGKENGVNDVEFFLNWLRSFRQVSNTKIQWLFCSSIGIESFTNQYNLSYTLNDVNSVSISEFSNAKATEFIQALSKSENLIFSDNHINHMLKKLGWNLPYFIQLLFSKTNQLVKIRECELAESTINVAYQMLISEKHLNTWDERLKEYSEHESSARLILRNLSRIQDGETRQTIFNLLYNKLQDEEKTEMVLSKLLYMLKNDGYINDGKGGRYLFRSPLLRDFWFHKFVK
jgi:hypothetical protein